MDNVDDLFTADTVCHMNCHARFTAELPRDDMNFFYEEKVQLVLCLGMAWQRRAKLLSWMEE